MTVAKVIVKKHDKGVGWYRMTIIGLRDSIGETTMELLMREETLRSIRNGADRALNGQAEFDPENLFNSED